MTQPAVEISSPILTSAPHPQPAPLAEPHPVPNPPGRPAAHPHPPGVLASLQSLLFLIVIAIFIITFSVQPFRIPSESMEPTLLVGDFLLVNKQSVAPGGSIGLLPAAAIHRGDVIVFHDPVDASLHLIKRVIGLPGDRLRLRGGRVFIDGRPLTEPYAVYRPSPPDNFRDNFPRLRTADPAIDSRWWIRMRSLIDNGDLIIPTGSYFVLGDNRNDSEDSRYWGFVPRNEIVGKPLFIYFSLRRRPDDPEDRDDPNAHPPFSASTHPRTRLDALLDFARWSRTLQIVR